MGKCLIAIDIGNTVVKTGLYYSGRLEEFKQLKFNDVPKYVNKIIKNGKYFSKDIVISSVNPEITSFINKRISRQKDTKQWLCGKNLDIKIKHNYRDYKKLGIDRKVNAYGAMRMYRLPLLVLSFGTAITCDYIDSKGIFKGGLIIPGPETSYKALLSQGALLPKSLIMPQKAPHFPGIDTVSCLESGILHGFGAMTDGLVTKFKERFGKKVRVLATGGLAKTLSSYSKSIDTVDPLHTIKSLMVLWRDNLRS